jgi:hypothetical protein
MAEEKKKAIEKDQEIKTPAGAPKEELSDTDFESVAGGMAGGGAAGCTCITPHHTSTV